MNLIEKAKTLVKNQRLLIVLLFVVLLLIIVFISSKKMPSPGPTPTPKPTPPSWQGIEPGKSTEAELKEKLGNPIKESEEKEQKILEYSSDYEYYPNKVYSHKETIFLVKEQITYDQNLNLQDYINQYGKPFTMYDKNLGMTYPLNVFSGQGIAVASHLATGRVIEIWYFEPMPSAEFIQTLGKELTQSPPKHF